MKSSTISVVPSTVSEDNSWDLVSQSNYAVISLAKRGAYSWDLIGKLLRRNPTTHNVCDGEYLLEGCWKHFASALSEFFVRPGSEKKVWTISKFQIKTVSSLWHSWVFTLRRKKPIQNWHSQIKGAENLTLKIFTLASLVLYLSINIRTDIVDQFSKFSKLNHPNCHFLKSFLW